MMEYQLLMDQVLTRNSWIGGILSVDYILFILAGFFLIIDGNLYYQFKTKANSDVRSFSI